MVMLNEKYNGGIPRREISRIRKCLKNRHQLDGYFEGGEHPFVALNWPSNLCSDTLNAICRMCVLAFGSSVQIVFLDKIYNNCAGIIVEYGSPFYEILLGRGRSRIDVILFYKNNPLKSFIPLVEISEDFDAELSQHKPLYYDHDIHRTEVVATISEYESISILYPITKHDRISNGWLDRVMNRSVILKDNAPLAKSLQLEAHEGLSFRLRHEINLFNEITIYLQTENTNLGIALKKFSDYVDVDPYKRILKFESLLQFLITNNGGQEVRWDSTMIVLEAIMELYMLSPRQAMCGLRIPYADTLLEQIKYLEIDTTSMNNDDQLDIYWTSLTYMHTFQLDLGLLLAPSERPVTEKELLDSFGQFDTSLSLKTLKQSYDDLFNELLSHKKWTIPKKTAFEFAFGPFNFAEITESDDLLYCVFRTSDWKYYIVRGYLPGKSIHFEICCDVCMDSPDCPLDYKKADLVSAMGRLLVVALIRDFCVIEKREAAFGRTKLKQRVTGTGSQFINNDSPPRVVYIPRVQYVNRPNVESLNDNLQYAARRKHFVSGHIRKVKSASPSQIALAATYGFFIPDGHTFVRPHERGHSHDFILYRSKSALSSLYGFKKIDYDSGENDPDTWYDFEMKVHKFLSSNGYLVKHVSASTSATGGVNIIAKKNDILGEITWLIRCKYSEKKIGPDVVRSLIESISEYPRETKGALITSGKFSNSSIEVANKFNIKLIDGKLLNDLIL